MVAVRVFIVKPRNHHTARDRGGEILTEHLRYLRANITGFLGGRQSVWTLLVALAPFAPGALYFLRFGVPDVLLTEDMASIELRTRFAAHGVIQFLGPYSRFGWSHPGPSLFYFALPVYELFCEHASALNLFALFSNLTASLFIVANARHLGGELFALVVALLLSIYDMSGSRFSVADAWNPLIVVLPFGLLCLISVRIARGELRLSPAAIFLASVIVQSHIGYLASVLVALAFPAATAIGRPFFVQSRVANLPEGKRHFLLSLAVLLAMWLVPIYESVSEQGGNLQQLWTFFKEKPPHAADYRESAEALATQLSLIPVAVARLFFAFIDFSPSAKIALAATLVLGLVPAAMVALRRQCRPALLLCLLSLFLTLSSWLAIRSIVGTIHDYLVVSVAIVGLLACAAMAAVLIEALSSAQLRRAERIVSIAAIMLVGLSLWRRNERPTVQPPDVALETVARDVVYHLRGLQQPVLLRFEHRQPWGRTMGLGLFLYKHDIPFVVENAKLPMFGSHFRMKKRPRSHLFLRSKPLSKKLCKTHRCELLATANHLFAYLEHK
jgi:hypothetical protein